MLETLNRIIARFDGSLPTPSMMQDVVDDIAREFEITLVSMYLSAGSERLTMVGVAGYPAPFHELEVGSGIIGRAAATLQTQFVPDVLADPDYRAARDDVRSEVAAPIVHSGELLGVVNFEGTLERPIGPTEVALAEMVVHALSRGPPLGPSRRRAARRLHAIERVLAVSRSLVADLDRRAGRGLGRRRRLRAARGGGRRPLLTTFRRQIPAGGSHGLPAARHRHGATRNARAWSAARSASEPGWRAGTT